MEIKFRQTEPYGCALYAVANCCKDFDNFPTEKRIEESKKGTSATDLSFYLKEDGFTLTVEPIYYDTYGKELPHHIKNMVSNGDDKNFLIVLISVKETEDSLPHLISGYLDHEGYIEILDSRKEKSFNIRLENINWYYEIVYGVFGLLDRESNNYIYLKIP